MSDLEQRVAAIEAFVASLKHAVGGAPVAGTTQHRTTHASGGGEVATDDLLNRDWADMEIKRDPKRWIGDSCVGRRMSECPADYLLEYASFHEWAGNKGKAEDPPRLDNKQRPWFERDFLIAKLARGFAKRAAAKPQNGAPRPRPAPAQAEFGEHPDDDGEIPF